MFELSMPELEAGLDAIRQSPLDGGALELIVRRPRTDEREVLHVGVLDLVAGLIGDAWAASGNWRGGKGPHPDTQLTIMNSRVIALVACERDRWPLAGDQFYLDLNLSVENLPPGARLELGSAILEITATPHTGCHKFAQRFGQDAKKFVNSPIGKALRLRGANAKVIQAGEVRVGDVARKVDR